MSVPVNITKHYSYSTDYSCLGYYICFSCFIGTHYITKTYKKRVIDSNFVESKFIYDSSLKWCSYIQTFLKLMKESEGY